MKLFFKILLFIFTMLITVGEAKSSTVEPLSQEEMSVSFFQEAESISYGFENHSKNSCLNGKELIPCTTVERWQVWHINEPDFTFVGKLQGENRDTEIGSVIAPIDVHHRIKTGKYSYYYPEFE